MKNKLIRWNEEKNQLLKLQRDVSFEHVLDEIENKRILGRKKHPNAEKYSKQEIFIFEIKGYIYYVPLIENNDTIFLKTIIPGKKLKMIYEDTNNAK